MTSHQKFHNDLHRGFVFESGIGHMLATIHGGSYHSYPYVTGRGQPSGDGLLTISGQDFNCEFKAEVNRYENFFFETHGANGRESALTVAAKQGQAWIHYNGRTDVLIVAWASNLLPFLEAHSGESGIAFKTRAGDGGRTAGFAASVHTITGQTWVHAYPNFSGTYLTGSHTLQFG